MDIKLKITRGKDQELYLTAKTMNELVDKIIDCQDYDSYKKTMKLFGKDIPKRMKKEKESGWYYIK
jgi:hypothetical protein